MVEKMGDIKGLGPNTVGELNDYGITSLEELAEADPQEIGESDEIKMSESRARKYSNKAQKASVSIMTGDEVFDEYQKMDKRSTGIKTIDEALGGGWEPGFLVAVGGESGSGKTQLAYQSLGQAVKDTGEPAVYIETEPGRYRGQRLREMFSPEVQSKVYKIEAYGLDQQKLAFEKVKEEMTRVSLVVVDSFTARFRTEEDFAGRENLGERSEEFAKQLNRLEDLAQYFDVPILLNCQIYANPSQYGTSTVIYGSSLMMHMVNFVVKLKDRSGALSVFTVENHPEKGDFEKQIQINSGGVDFAE